MRRKPKKVVVIGPESTGKSTLSEALAAHYQESWVKEYAREYIDMLDRAYRYEDLLEIAKGQLALEDRKSQEAKKLLFCDTDLHVIHVWSEFKYNQTHPWITEQISERQYDLYLLTDIDIPWQDDPQREYPDPKMRQYFYNWYERLMLETGIPLVKVSGNLEQRLVQAISGIEQYLK